MAQIKKISEGKYLIRASKGTGPGRTFINKIFRGKKKDAKAYAREQETHLDQGFTTDSRLTFATYLEKWLLAVKPKLAPRTIDGYEGYIKRYATAKLGTMRLSEIRTFHIQDVLAGVDKSPTTIRNLHAALRASFAYAVRGGILRDNPCRNVDLPRKTHKEIRVLTIDEACRFAEIARTMTNGLIFEFALETGMRPEEYLALRWRDLDGREVSVQQAVQFNRKGGGYYFKELKTARSRRRVPISEDLRLLLATHRREQLKHRLAMKGTWFDHDLIFANIIGRPHPLPNLTRRYFKPILDKCEFDKHITLYALRHSCATILLMLGENPKVVADRLGHSSVSMTLDVYSHVLPHIQDNATEKMANVMRAKK